ncbi:MAG: carboxypeptidase regulatory-like domain-containing protein, partial [Planctomycetaceae bacterium]|nr:carboxypeptidase regulatory-like domain-containing protein [Planctomycetaceae bacterium]
IRDVGEEGIAGAQVVVQYLPTSGSVPDPTVVVTDANGFWIASGLRPGAYGVAEVQPAGWLDGKDAAGSLGGTANNPGDTITGITLLSAANGVNYDFGELLPSSITGMIHADLDGDCMYDSGEPLLAGVTVKLYDEQGTLLATTQTNAQGQYLFSGLAPGKYTVEEVQPANYYQGGSSLGNAGGQAVGYDKFVGITLVSGTAAQEYNFCEMVGASLSGMVHADLDGDCLYDEGEPLLEGVTVWLLDASGARIRSTTTNAHGEYTFTNLEPGTYGVEQIQPAGYYEAGSSVGSAGGQLAGTNKILGATLGSGVNATDYNFCEKLPASLSGMVHADLDGDCLYDEGEPMLAGVTIWLLDASGSRLRSTTTNAQGEYSFTDLEPGTYGVEEVQPAGYYEAGSSVGSAGGQLAGTNKILGATLGSGVNATDYDFCELLPASVTGVIHADRDGDCEYDEDEPLLTGVTVWLLDANGTRLRSTTTDQNGRYTFTNLNPGTYGIEEVQPNGYFDAGSMVGSAGGQKVGDNKFQQIVLGSGVNATEYNFCELEPASLCGVVYADLNQNGVRDSGETGIAGVTLRLLDANGIATGVTVVTGADGSYCFLNLRPGTYGIAEVQPNGYFDGLDTVGDAGGTANNPGDSITGITLGAGQEANFYNFGEIPPGKISGYVFQDGPAVTAQPGQALDVTSVRDGVRTSDDTPLAGIVLRLGTANGLAVLDAAGQPITAVTDADGYYEFNNLPPGVYTVFEDHPSPYVDGIDTPGSLGGLAINPGDLVPVGMVVDPRFDAIVQINLGAGQESVENNFSEVATVAPPAPPTPAPVFGLVPMPTLSPPAAAAAAYGLGAPQYLPLQPYMPRPLTQNVYIGGNGYLDSYSWHLSIIDAGTPRGLAPVDSSIVLSSNRFDLTSWTGAPMNHGQWELLTQDETPRQVVFGLADGIPVTGDFNGDGITDIGVFADGEWFIDLNGNGIWDEDDLWVKLGAAGDLPITGDWDGDGKTDIGVYGPEWGGDNLAIRAEPGLPDPYNRVTGPVKNLPPKPTLATHGERTLKKSARGNLRSDVIDHVFRYGVAGYVPVTGDWNGDGTDTIGVFFGGTWRLDTNGDGRWSEADEKVEYGLPGDLPVVGDFDGDGIDEIGVYRRGVWYIDQDHNRKLDPHDQLREWGDGDDLPVVGDWDGDGQEEPGLYKDGVSKVPLQ